VYDLAHKAWSIDAVSGPVICATGQWVGGEVAIAKATVGTTNSLGVTNSTFSDFADLYTTQITTGDLRPFGVLSEGSMTKIQVLSELRSACTLSIGKSTENGTNITFRTFALAAGDYQVGQLAITDIELGPYEAREVNKLQIELTETSAVEGLAFIALAIEHEQGEGLKRASPLSRVT